MLTVAMISFALFRFVGDPVAQMVGQDTTAAQRAQLREALGINEPVPKQFARFVADTARGDFGISFRLRQPVSQIIAKRLPATLELSFVAAIFAISIGIPMGVYTGLYPDRIMSKIFLVLSLVGISLPTFFIGILFIFVFGVVFGWLPTFGRGDVVQIGWWSTGLLTASGWKSIIMPAFTLGLFQLTLVMRLVRSEMIEVLRTDYIKFARARGLTNRAINFGHALRNTLVPVMTITGLQLGSIIAFAIITETVFQWPGMGLLFLQAIQYVDIPIMSAYLVVIAFFFVIINLTVDLLYFAVDPRLRVESSQSIGN